jgi:hypothetical protein
MTLKPYSTPKGLRLSLAMMTVFGLEVSSTLRSMRPMAMPMMLLTMSTRNSTKMS